LPFLRLNAGAVVCGNAWLAFLYMLGLYTLPIRLQRNFIVRPTGVDAFIQLTRKCKQQWRLDLGHICCACLTPVIRHRGFDPENATAAAFATPLSITKR